jgi:hypothetical protein
MHQVHCIAPELSLLPPPTAPYAGSMSTMPPPPAVTPGFASTSGRGMSQGYPSGASSPPQRSSYAPPASSPSMHDSPAMDGKQFFQVARCGRMRAYIGNNKCTNGSARDKAEVVACIVSLMDGKQFFQIVRCASVRAYFGRSDEPVLLQHTKSNLAASIVAFVTGHRQLYCAC